MEAQLQSLIDKIKSDGIEKAEKESKEILEKAEVQAASIVNSAKVKAAEIINTAQKEAQRSEEAGKKALEQAGRNLILALRHNITELFERLLHDEVKAALTSETIKKMLEKIADMRELHGGTKGEIEALLGKADADALSRGMLAKLQQKIKSGVVLKPTESLEGGFFVGEKGGNVHYDFSSKGISEALSAYLNPKLAEVIKES